ncbi:hypothetical protein COV11_00935 [Candidatus Woesearchaeota archaeon CG10_big_fil_rev_8_21_14_0_10_30_7]|nr:MAG: hypothetical protein COV11_00935 [Candidatus Woesearchaeota archaeon CG10_big_fil_rev_8_21_14_0_10_30_7]
MVNKQLLTAISTLIGYIIGAGILGIPFIIAKAGFLTSLPLLIGLGILMIIVDLCLGEITLRTKGTHQLTGYMGKYLGYKGKFLMMISLIIGIYGSLLAYIIGVGQSLTAIFGGSTLLWSVLFFVIASSIIYGGLDWLKKSENILMLFLLIVFSVIVIVLLFSGHFSISNLTLFQPNNFLFPFGVILFAYLSTGAVPVLHRELKNKKLLKKTIIYGISTTIFVYTLFAFIVVGVMGVNTTQIATIGIGELLGSVGIIFFNLFAILAMTTSFIALGFALKDMFEFDYKFNFNTAWFFTISVPLIFFLTFKTTFTQVLSWVGSITGGLACVLILLAYLKVKKLGNRKPEYTINISKWFVYLIILVYIIGALFEVGLI